MKRLTLRLGLFGSIGIAWITMTGVGQAWELPEIDARAEFHVELKHGLKQPRPTAPWYAYFPVDPRMQPSPQMSPYPSWPAPYPPPMTPFAVPNMRAQVPPANAPRSSQVTQLWPYQSGYGANLQPVGYWTSPQTPSYWYRNP